MRALILAALAVFALSGCVLLEDDFWDDYDSAYDSPSGGDYEDCDC